MNKTTETQRVEVARHIPSGCLLLGGRWTIDYTDQDIADSAGTDYHAHADIVDEDMDAYDASNIEQEHEEDYDIITIAVEKEMVEWNSEEYRMAAAIVSSSAWGGRARTAQQLLDSSEEYPEQITELYSQIDQAEMTMDDLLSQGIAVE